MKSEQEVPVSIEIYDKKKRHVNFKQNRFSEAGNRKNTVLIFDLPLQLLAQNSGNPLQSSGHIMGG